MKGDEILVSDRCSAMARRSTIQSHALLGAIVLTLGGCGGESSVGGSEKRSAAAKPTVTAGPSPAAPTKAAYIDQLEAICTGRGSSQARRESSELNRGVGASFDRLNDVLAKRGDPKPVLRTIARQHFKIARARADAARRLREVKPPDTGAATVFLKRLDGSAAVTREFAEMVQRLEGPPEGWVDKIGSGYGRVALTTERSKKAARAYGAKRCAV